MARNKSKTKRAQAERPARAAFTEPAAAPAERAGGEKPLWLWPLAALLVVSGYLLLHKADPYGRNIWAVVSPALLLSGYLAIIPAIILTFRD